MVRNQKHKPDTTASHTGFREQPVQATQAMHGLIFRATRENDLHILSDNDSKEKLRERITYEQATADSREGPLRIFEQFAPNTTTAIHSGQPAKTSAIVTELLEVPSELIEQKNLQHQVNGECVDASEASWSSSSHGSSYLSCYCPETSSQEQYSHESGSQADEEDSEMTHDFEFNPPMAPRPR